MLMLCFLNCIVNDPITMCTLDMGKMRGGYVALLPPLLPTVAEDLKSPSPCSIVLLYNNL